MSETNPTELAAVQAAAIKPLSIKDTVLAQFKEAETTITTLADRYRDVAYDVKTPKGMKDAIAARADLRDNGRLFLTRAETRIKGEVNDLKRVMADEVERLVAIVKPVEEAVDAQIKAEEQRKAAEKAERERIEAERVAKHRANIDKLKSYVERAKGQPVENIEKAIDVLANFPIGEEYEEFLAEAQAARLATVESLSAMVAAERERIAKEAESARVAAELAAARAELEALRQKQAEAERKTAFEQQAEAQRQAREAEEKASQVVQKAAEPIPAAMTDALTMGTGIVSMTAESVTRIDPATVRNDATLKLGDINAKLAPIQITAAGLAELGFQPVGKEKSAVLFKATDFPAICQAIAKHVIGAVAKA
jgi:chromosome segregation ATPase